MDTSTGVTVPLDAMLVMVGASTLNYHQCSLIIGVFLNIFLGDEKVVRALIELGAKVNAENNRKITPLHHAAFWGKSFAHLHLMNFQYSLFFGVFTKICSSK